MTWFACIEHSWQVCACSERRQNQ